MKITRPLFFFLTSSIFHYPHYAQNSCVVAFPGSFIGLFNLRNGRIRDSRCARSNKKQYRLNKFQTSSVKDHANNNDLSVVIAPGSNISDETPLIFKETLIVEGTFIGRIRCDSGNHGNTLIKVGNEGLLESETVFAHNIEIYGKVIGNLECAALKIGKTGKVIGSISANKMVVEEGASILGTVTCCINEHGHQGTTFPQISENGISMSISTDSEKKDSGQLVTGNEVLNDEFLDSFGNTIFKYNPNNKGLEAFNEHKEMSMDLRNILYDKPRYWKKKKNKPSSLPGEFVDNFGNPLLGWANEDEINSFRQVRKMSMEMRDLLDTHKKNKEEESARLLSDQLFTKSKNMGEEISRTYHLTLGTSIIPDESSKSLNMERNGSFQHASPSLSKISSELPSYKTQYDDRIPPFLKPPV